MNSNFLYDLENSGRHNLVLLRCADSSLTEAREMLRGAGVEVIDIGRKLAERLQTLESAKFLTIEAQEYLRELMEKQARQVVSGKPKVVAIYNLGILLEPALSLNVANLLKEISKNVAIVILWDQLGSAECLHWGLQQEQYHLNLSGIYVAEEIAGYEV